MKPMKFKWFKGKKKDGSAAGGINHNQQQTQQQQQQQQQQQRADGDLSGSEYTDDEDNEHVHDFEIAQEDYLVSVALATSANEYQKHVQSGGSHMLPSSSGRGAALSKQYWMSNV
eukprot:jgi/Chrzof1/1049/Cz01g38140.t1